MNQEQLRQNASAVIKAALEEVDPYRNLKRALELDGDTLVVGGESIDLGNYRRIVAVGAGKAAAPMARALEDVLGKRLSAGRVVVKDGHSGPTEIVEIFESSHPVPDERGVAAGQRIGELLREYAANDTLCFCLLSGGGSALLVSPAEGLTLADKQEVTRLLLACGADIREINTLRKHLSTLKGGGLARLAAPSRVISLIVSDVVGDRLDTIASGPTVPDETTWQDCEEILKRYEIYGQIPAKVRARIEKGLAGELADTPKPGDAELGKVRNLVVASCRQALSVAAEKARELGMTPLILSSTIEGETSDIARMHSAMVRESKDAGHPLPAPCCLISGGETTVSLGKATGLGGRNQEFALVAAFELEGMKDVLAVSFGTDGTDGPTDAAGAMADGSTLARARAAGLDPAGYLAGHDSYHFFEKLGDLIITGPTRTNVMDVRLMLVG